MKFTIFGKRRLIFFFLVILLSQISFFSCVKKETAKRGVVARVGNEDIKSNEVLRSITGKARDEVKNNPDSAKAKEIIKKALDNVIDWNVLYFSGKSESLDKREDYLVQKKKMRIGLLSGMYLHKKVAEETEISGELIKEYYDKMSSYLKGRELDDELKSKIKFVIIDENFRKYSRELIDKLKKGHKLEVYGDKVKALLKDDSDSNDTVVGQLDDYRLDWKAFKELLGRTPSSESEGVIIEMVRDTLEKVMLANEAEKAGMEKEDSFLKSMRHFEKNRVALAKRVEIANGISIADEEAKKYYRRNKMNYTDPESVDINIILSDTEEDAKRLREEIDKNGDNIPSLAVKFSKMEGANENSGVFEKLTKTMLDEMFGDTVAKKIFSSASGKVKGPVKGERGYYIFRVNFHRSKNVTSFDAVKRNIKAFLKDKQVEEVIGKLRAKEKIETFPENLKFEF